MLGETHIEWIILKIAARRPHFIPQLSSSSDDEFNQCLRIITKSNTPHNITSLLHPHPRHQQHP